MTHAFEFRRNVPRRAGRWRRLAAAACGRDTCRRVRRGRPGLCYAATLAGRRDHHLRRPAEGYQTIFAATNALKGAAYTVNWTNFIGGPPVIAAETGGSVDLGDMAETPTIFAQ